MGRKSGRQLNRNSSHRQAMFKNMAGSLVKHEVIKTTLPKAKELRRVIEPLITMAKEDSVANRRLAFARTGDKDQANDKQFVQMEAIINSMTPGERARPDIIKGSRKRRIAAGSGTQIQDVNRLLKQFTQMQK